MGPERSRGWLELWDASSCLPLARIPYLWLSGTNDRFYPMPSLQRSCRLARGPRTLSIRPGMKHSHPDDARPEEIFAYAVGPLPRVAGMGTEWKEARVRFQACAGVVSARLEFTRDAGPWVDRKWESMPARIDAGREEARCELPQAAAWFFNLADARGNIVSSEHAGQ